MTTNEAIINQTGSEEIYPGHFIPTTKNVAEWTV